MTTVIFWLLVFYQVSAIIVSGIFIFDIFTLFCAHLLIYSIYLNVLYWFFLDLTFVELYTLSENKKVI